MGKTKRVLRRLALVLAGGSAALAVGFSLLFLPLGELLLAGIGFLQSPAAAAYALAQTAETGAVSRSVILQESEEAPAAAPQPSAAPSPAPAASPTPAPAPTATPDPGASPPPGAGTVVPETFGQGSGEGYVSLDAGSIKNATDHTDAELQEAARGGLPFAVELNSDEPQVLILHTHATETYQPWDALWYSPDFTARISDTARNMCAVGERMTEILNAAGVNTLHDTTLHDDPSYTESYGRSAQTARAYLEKYPSIKVILDVHRDAIERDGARIKPLTQLDGAETAQVMIICGCSNGDSIRLPNWRLNLRFAAAWENQMEALYPGLTRPVLCGYRFYNQDVTTGSLLIEIGGHANTLAEALRGGEYAAKALAALFGGEGAA